MPPERPLADRKIVAYLSHPIGDADDMIARHNNIENAGHWLRFLVKNTKWAIICPWLAYLTAVGDQLHRPRSLMDQMMILERADIITHVGGYLSEHMGIERAHSIRNGQPAIDLTMFGDRPFDEEAIMSSLNIQAEQIKATHHRHVWLPPLDQFAIDALREAERALVDNPRSQEAVSVIQQIVRAALRVG